LARLDKDVVVDQYRVAERLGAGAMGEVYLARDEKLGRKVALKILLEAHRENPELRARFGREARAVAAISHSNVVQVFSIGEFDGRPYLAMELLSGHDLMSIVRSGGPMPSRRAASVVRDAARGLQAAQRAGLMHRDVKPSNIMLLPDGALKVTDFGLAKPVDPGQDPALTAMGVVVGTPDYIAPEQARGDEIDPRVDVYALGCTLFFLLTGRPPYRRSVDDEEKYLKVVARHLRDPVPDPRKERPDVDDELADLGMAMMAKEADRRPSYDAVIAAAERIDRRLAQVGEPAAKDQAKVSTRPLDSQERPRTGGQKAEAATRGSSVARAAPDASTGGSLDLPRAAGLSRGLVAVTVVSAAIFVVGLALLLFGPMPERPEAQAAPPPPDGGPAPRADAAVLVEQTRPPPPGMLAVPAEGARAAFFVDRAPVTNREYAEFKKSHRFARKDAERPVTGVPFAYAVEYAKFRGKRLLRVEEWAAASSVPSFVLGGMKLYEWVDDGARDAGDRPVRGVNGAAREHKAAGDKSVTFRLAL
jgi:serine/threonine-protein kinase